jgi:hypothetical protein
MVAHFCSLFLGSEPLTFSPALVVKSNSTISSSSELCGRVEEETSPFSCHGFSANACSSSWFSLACSRSCLISRLDLVPAASFSSEIPASSNLKHITGFRHGLRPSQHGFLVILGRLWHNTILHKIFGILK